MTLALIFSFVLMLAPPGLQDAVRLQETVLRRAATVSPKPVYPDTSAAKKVSGVAVAEVSIGMDGRVTKVEILQAADQATGQAVRDACTAWVVPWKAGPRGEAARPRTGKLTFYFRIVSGTARVFNPEELAGAAPDASRTGSGAKPGSPPPASGLPAAARAPSVETLTFAAFQKLPSVKRPTVLDTGTRETFARSHTEGAINIPIDELRVRAPIELDRSRPLAIDCTQDEMWRCQAAATMLRERQFSDMVILVQ